MQWDMIAFTQSSVCVQEYTLNNGLRYAARRRVRQHPFVESASISAPRHTTRGPSHLCYLQRISEPTLEGSILQ